MKSNASTVAGIKVSQPPQVRPTSQLVSQPVMQHKRHVNATGGGGENKRVPESSLCEEEERRSSLENTEALVVKLCGRYN